MQDKDDEINDEMENDEDEDIYSEGGREELIDETEIDISEEGFMEGYESEMKEPPLYDQKIRENGELEVSSPAFGEQNKMPRKYAKDEMNLSPPLDIKNIPEKTKSMVIIASEETPSLGEPLIHWLVYDITPTEEYEEDNIDGLNGKNDFKQEGWTGPSSKEKGKEIHFEVYALDDRLDIPSGETVQRVKEEMEGHVLAYGNFFGIV